METFYAILYCTIRPAIDERISIALLLKAENKVLFKYSQEKLKIAKLLLPKAAYNLLRTSLNNIERFINAGNESNISQSTLWDSRKEGVVANDFLRSDYIGYLNKYANNLLQFSEPKDIQIHSSEDGFDILYRKFIFTSEAKIDFGKKRIKPDEIKGAINPVIESHVNLEAQLTSREVATLIVPTPLWFIGKNDQDVTGEIIDFEKPTYFLENDIREHLYLLQSLRESKPQYSGKHFLVGAEPDKSNALHHSIWEELRKVPFISYLSSEEIGQITDYIKTHKVEPYFDKVEGIEDAY